jgi:hypothetical protein
MSCCASKKRTKNKEKRFKKNKIYPRTNYDYKNSKVDNELINHMRKDVILCGGCKQAFTLGSNELKIHCNGCDKFFHCKIAGKCQGTNCCLKLSDDSIHRASFCYSCAKLNYNYNQCLCRDCFKDSFK